MNFAQFAQTKIGSIVQMTNKLNNVHQLRFIKLSDKLGTLKDGSKGEYIVVESNDGAIVHQIHPQIALTLFKTGQQGMYQVIEEKSTAEVAQPVAEVVTEQPKLNKKALFVQTFKKLNKAGKTRKEVKAAVAEVMAISDAGFNTYYQNCRSGMWA